MSNLLEAVGDAAVITKRNLIKIKRVPDLLVFTTLSPIMFVLLFAYVFGGAKVLAAALREFDEAGIELQDVGLRRPTLDDVFLSLTGHAAEVAEPGPDGQKPTTPEEVSSP